MLALALLSSVAIYSVISMSVSSVSSLSSAKSVVGLSWFAVLLALLVVFVKVPSWPFSVWLPEAHVEASWGGSVVLAGYALKFATIALLLFSSTRFTTMDPAVTLLGFSIVFSSLAICSTFDSKKVVANLSIIHMSATGILLLSCSGSQSDFLLGLSWHHHSIVTGATFLLIGWTYAVSGSRVFRYLVVNPAASVIFLTLYFAILTMSLDLPWTPNVLVEISFVKIISSTGNLLVLTSLVVFFLVVILGFIKIATGLAKRSTSGLGGMSDLSVSRIAVVVVSSILIVAIGFGLGRALESATDTFWRDLNSRVCVAKLRKM